MRAFADSNAGEFPVPEGTHVEPTEAGGVPAEWHVPADVLQAGGGPDEGILLYLHGGAFLFYVVVTVLSALRLRWPWWATLLAVIADPDAPEDRRVDPHHWADAAKDAGFILQPQPAVVQPDGSAMPPTTHLTLTPVSERVLPELLPVLAAAADAVRGVPHVDASELLAQLPPLDGPLDSDTAAALLAGFGIGGGGSALPDRMAPLMAVIEAAPDPLAERLLVELLGRLVEPR